MSEHCRELADMLSSCLDGEIEGDDLQRVMDHLAECQCCRHCLDTIKATRDALQKMDSPEMPADLKERLKQCLRENTCWEDET